MIICLKCYSWTSVYSRLMHQTDAMQWLQRTVYMLDVCFCVLFNEKKMYIVLYVLSQNFIFRTPLHI